MPMVLWRFDGKELIVINFTTGVLYLVDTETGIAFPIDMDGEETLFPLGDRLHLEGHTRYICQNFGNPGNKVAVVQLSGDLTKGRFVENVVSENLDIPTTSARRSQLRRALVNVP